MNNICVIGAYFGKFPRYFPLWLKSCAKNPTVDFLIFTNQDISDTPENIKIYPMTLEKMKKLAEIALGFPVSLERPYKCCDFKVIYGLIFREYLSQYDYWGHCDFDLIFGDLQMFFKKYNLYGYDRFLPLGHLSLYRDCREVNYRFQCAGAMVDYKTVFTTNKSYAFDELPGLTRIYLQNGFSMLTERIFADIASVYHRYRIIDEYSLDIKAKNYKYQVFYWEKGKIYRAFWDKGSLHKEEYIYIHFKKRPNFTVDFDAEDADSFYITNQGFFPKTKEVTLEDIKRYNPYHGWLYEKFEKSRYKIKTYWCRLVRYIKEV